MKRPLLPKYKRMLDTLGENIRLARLRRDYSTEQVAERAGISRNTVIKIEHGDEGVSLGSYFRVLIVLGLHDDLLLLAKDDVLGRKIQDAGLKGYTVGGAQVSIKHSGFVINIGGATAADIISLMHLVQARVKEQFGVDLEPEVRIIGVEEGESDSLA